MIETSPSDEGSSFLGGFFIDQWRAGSTLRAILVPFGTPSPFGLYSDSVVFILLGSILQGPERPENLPLSARKQLKGAGQPATLYPPCALLHLCQVSGSSTPVESQLTTGLQWTPNN